MSWGYRTSFKKGIIINARSETVMNKPIFKDDFYYRRCLIPASGFYEWDVEKQRYLFYSDELFYFGGIYKFINGIYYYVILTRPSTELVAKIHERMPVIIANEMIPDWFLNFKAAYELINDDSVNLKMNLIDSSESSSQLSFTFED
jgi:putative SOS response-associated peptidase YedK